VSHTQYPWQTAPLLSLEVAGWVSWLVWTDIKGKSAALTGVQALVHEAHSESPYSLLYHPAPPNIESAFSL
jgi:hypothetical protein